jgi:hypothetical protein
VMQVGRNSCFAHALIQMILGVPQLAMFFATHDWQAEDIGALLHRCLALLWLREDDQEGPEAVELLRARLDGDFGQNYHQLQKFMVETEVAGSTRDSRIQQSFGRQSLKS